MDRRAVANDMLSRIRQAAIERPRLFKLKPNLLLALCDELIAFRTSCLTPNEAIELAQAKRERRVLPPNFEYILLSDGTHVVLKPKMASFRVENRSYYIPAEAALRGGDVK